MIGRRPRAARAPRRPLQKRRRPFAASATSAPTTSRAALLASAEDMAQHGAASTDDVAAAARAFARADAPSMSTLRTHSDAPRENGPAAPRNAREASRAVEPFARASTKARAATAAPGPPSDARRDRASMGAGAFVAGPRQFALRRYNFRGEHPCGTLGRVVRSAGVAT